MSTQEQRSVWRWVLPWLIFWTVVIAILAVIGVIFGWWLTAIIAFGIAYVSLAATR